MIDVPLSVDALLRDARQQLRVVDTRRRELQKIIQNLMTLKRRKMPSELFAEVGSQGQKPSS